MSGRTTSSAWLQGIVEMLEGIGLDVDAILAEAGIDRTLLSSPDNRAPTEMVSRLWNAAKRHSDNPAIGLVSPHVPKPGNFDIVGYAMMSSPNLIVALQNFARHLRLVSDAASIHLELDEICVRLELKLFGGSEPIPRQRVEFDLLTLLTFYRWVSGRSIRPLGLWLEWPAPEDVAPYQDAFQCPIHFEADFNGLEFSRPDIEAKLPGFNPDVAGLHDSLVRQRLAALDGSSLTLKVREEIIRRLSSGEPRRENVAQALRLSDRTLTRRLREENVSFLKLLDETRRDLAQDYLAKPKMSLAEVAYLLGFSDQSAFFRACKRWFDASPGQFRASMCASQPLRPASLQRV